MMTLPYRACAVLTLAMTGAWLAPWAATPAQACGGTFCDSGPTAMPVEQTGETILFVVDGTHVEAHIQIAYDPEAEAEQFAWVVPVTALPEFAIGSQPLFTNLLQGTVPSYGMNDWSEPCGSASDGFGGDGCDEGGADESGGGGIKLDSGAGSDPPGPEVVVATTVGAFEVFVLDGGTAEGVMQWLGDNGFQQDAAATPILDEYLAEGHLFVAFRLLNDAEASEIHPIVLRYEGTEPCVPIRLTRIAAKEDMEIRALLLGDSPYASSNYRHVTLDPLRLDWIGSGANYREVVGMAIDEPGADGHAFVTEYAGPSDVVSTVGLLGELWDAAPFMTATAQEAVELLFSQELVLYDFDSGDCVAANPLVEGLVMRYLPSMMPDVPFEELCSDPPTYIATVDPLAWDGAAFAADLQQRVIDPSAHALELLQTWPTLTRLYTMLSPGEMTLDPMFHATPELPEQTNLSILGTRNLFCDGDASFELPDGRLVALPDASTWPAIYPDQLPWAETISYLPAAGAPLVEVDNRDAIQALLDAWNTEYGPPRSPSSPSCHGELDTGNVGGSGASSGTGGTAGGADVEGRGCGCRSDGEAPGAVGALGLLVLGSLRRRRRAAVSSPA